MLIENGRNIKRCTTEGHQITGLIESDLQTRIKTSNSIAVVIRYVCIFLVLIDYGKEPLIFLFLYNLFYLLSHAFITYFFVFLGALNFVLFSDFILYIDSPIEHFPHSQRGSPKIFFSDPWHTLNCCLWENEKTRCLLVGTRKPR